MADARQVAADWIEAFNAHDEGRMRSVTADDATLEAPGDVRIEGGEGVTEYAMAWLRAFPDARLNVHNQFGAGEWDVHEFTFEGTHEDTLVGPAGEIPATHKRLVGRATQILRVADGKVAEVRLYFDQVQVLTQLGLMPQLTAA